MRRRQGGVTSAAGLVPFGHLGWGYRNRDEFFARAAEYIADGLARNQWVEYVGGGDRAHLADELAAISERHRIGDTSGVVVTPAPEFYAVPEGSDVVDPHAAVDRRVAAVAAAVAAGYSGFRAVSDATAVARTPAQRDAFAIFEFLIDQQMAVHPVSALCAYDVSQLGDTAAPLLCLHPFTGPQTAKFRVYAQPGESAESASVFALAGELDAAEANTFATVLNRIGSLPWGEQMIIDAHALEFITHRQLLAIDDRARAHDRRVVLRGAQAIAVRLAGLLPLTNLTVVPPEGDRATTSTGTG